MESNETLSNSKEECLEKAKLLLQNDISNDSKKIERPNINVKKIVFLLISLAIVQISFVSIALYSYIKLKNIFLMIVFLVLTFLVIILTIKNTIINIILLYQRFASEKLRSSCLFEPTCSEYMILAIKKYGTIKGIYKGINRLLRCHFPNGGIDYP